MNHSKYSRRDFLINTSLTAAGLALTKPIFGSFSADVASRILYVGTYTSLPGGSSQSEGIYIFRMNVNTGELVASKTVAGVQDPSFLAFDPKRRHLFAVNEVDQFENKPSGSVSSFSIDKQSGELKFINKQPTAGASPCHLTVDKTGKYVLVANYGGGSVAVLPIKNDGTLGAMSSFVQHQGSSINKDRQQGPHAHCIELDDANKFAFAVDLGIDKILSYRFDEKTGKLSANSIPAVDITPGAGPRHLTFHPNGKFVYVISELANTVVAFSYDRSAGTLKQLQTVATLPSDFSGQSATAEVVISPSGKFLYGSNRGHDSIVSFAINQDTGMLSLIEHVSTQGKHPRHFTIEPSGNFLLVANRDSDSIVSFRIDKESGRLQATGQVTQVPRPVCLLFS